MLLKWDLLYYLKLLKLKCLCVPYNFSTNGTYTMRPTLLGNSSSVLHGFLRLHDDMRQILTHPSVSTVHRRLEWNWQDGRKFWQTVENTKLSGNSIKHIFKSLQHFQRTGSRKVFLLKGKAVFKQCIAKKYKCFGKKIYKLCNSTGYTYSIKVYFRKDRQCPAQQLTAAHATVT